MIDQQTFISLHNNAQVISIAIISFLAVFMLTDNHLKTEKTKGIYESHLIFGVMLSIIAVSYIFIFATDLRSTYPNLSTIFAISRYYLHFWLLDISFHKLMNLETKNSLLVIIARWLVVNIIGFIIIAVMFRHNNYIPTIVIIALYLIVAIPLFLIRIHKTSKKMKAKANITEVARKYKIAYTTFILWTVSGVLLHFISPLFLTLHLVGITLLLTILTIIYKNYSNTFYWKT